MTSAELTESTPPNLKVSPKFDNASLHRDSSIASSDLANSDFELLDLLGAHANLPTVTAEDES